MAPRLEIDRHTLRLIAIAFVLLAGLSVHRLILSDSGDDLEVLIVQGETMGTTYALRIAGPDLDERLGQRIEAETERRLEQIDSWMSNWNPDSEIARFNAHRRTDGFRVSSETAELMAYAVELGKWSGGAFDVTVGPLVALWGFGEGARVGAPPTDAEIDERLQHVGARLLRVGRGNSESGGFLRKNDPDLEVDLSAIAKGFGVDHVAAGLEALGRRDYLVEIGGEVRASGERPGGGPWRVAIEKPRDAGRAIQSIVELRDQSMATSGDYRIFYLEGGRRVSHTIDPRNGRPVGDGPASATVIAASATEADAWATTLMVLGAPEGLSLATQWNLAAMLLVRGDDGEIIERRNELFPATLSPGDDPGDVPSD